MSENSLEGLAIIGMSCRFPKARNLDEYWKNLYNAKECINFFSSEELIVAGVPSTLLEKHQYVKACGVLEDIALFDAKLFGLSPNEAKMIDPQARIFLECAWEVFEDAGYDTDRCNGLIGVYAGSGYNSYLQNNIIPNGELFSRDNFSVMIGNMNDHIPTRVSYKLDLRGPSINVQTACSTSLVAVHLACQSLLNYQCDLALAGGVKISVPQKQGYVYQQNAIMSPDGHCRAFDAKSKGTVNGNGIGVVLLKRLSEAITDRDHIYAVIRGTAINNDGSDKVGYTAPSIHGQRNVIMEAQAVSGVDPETITYIEAHGTGTELGDPIEIAALTEAFRSRTDKKGYCAIGSVKSNIGHLDSAAGVAGLIKTVLSLQHKQIPASLHFEEPNPRIDFANSPFYVNSKLSQWESGGAERRAGVSSFGIGGTNAHVILEEAPLREASGPSRPFQLIILSAKTESALQQASSNLCTYIKEHGQENLADVAYTLQTGRRGFNHRAMMICESMPDAAEILDSCDPKKYFTGVADVDKGRGFVFMFSGQGSQYLNMGLDLYRHESVFRDHVDRCSKILKPELGMDLSEFLYSGEDNVRGSLDRINETYLAQPVLFVLEYCLAKLWMSWLGSPDCMIGHSIGEYVAACLSGVFSLEDALGLVCVRGRLMQDMPRGGMLSVNLSEEQLQEYFESGLSLAVINGPFKSVVSGRLESIDRLQRRLFEEGVACRLLHTSHAFHSEMMDPVSDKFSSYIKGVKLGKPEIPYVSNVTGTWITEDDINDISYWSRHLRNTVRFSEGLEELFKRGDNVLLEVGPGNVLSTLALSHVSRPRGHLVLNSIRHPSVKESDVSFLLRILGRLWLCGVKINWDSYTSVETRNRLALPSYPFERQRYWIDRQAVSKVNHELSKGSGSISDCFYVPSWIRCPLPICGEMLSENNFVWLVFLDDFGIGSGLVDRLDRPCQEVICVRLGTEFSKLSDHEYTLNPVDDVGYHNILEDLKLSDKLPHKIIHLWLVNDESFIDVDVDAVERTNELGLFSLILLCQAFEKHSNLRKLEITIVSNNMYDVIGDEVLSPCKSTVLGAIRVIPYEYNNIWCGNIDVLLPCSGGTKDKVVSEIIKEITALKRENVVAYRHSSRWVENYKSINLLDVPGSFSRLRNGGIYLITGGLGGIGLEIAEFLARTIQPKLVLVDKISLPPIEKWSEWIDSNQDNYSFEENVKGYAQDISVLDKNIALTDNWVIGILEKLRKELDILDLDSNTFKKLHQTLDRLCASYAYDYIKTSNLELHVGSTYSKNRLRSILKVIPDYNKLFEYIIKVLEEDNIIKQHDGLVTFIKGSNDVDDPEVLVEHALIAHFEFKGIFRLIEHCFNYYYKVLTGQLDGLNVLFPEGNPMLLNELLSKNVRPHSHQILYTQLVSKIVTRILDTNSSQSVKIIEIGAGSGSLTNMVVSDLIDRKNVEYHFTDIAKSFVVNAEKQAINRNLGFMRFGVYDASKDPSIQGYDECSFDMVLGLNVIHATKKVKESIRNLKRLLRPGGIMLLIETTRSDRWINMVWGLSKQWWNFEDEHLRENTPLLSMDKWEQVFNTLGFKSVNIYPRDPQFLRTDCALIIAQQGYNLESANVRQRQHLNTVNIIKRLSSMMDLGIEISIQRADISDLSQMRQVVDNVIANFGNVHGVFHAAGLPGGGVIELIKPHMAAKELAPKVLGTIVLDKLLRNVDLDFFILFSSLNSFLGKPGHTIYSAANLFIDAFSHYKFKENSKFYLSINWDRWLHTGMALDVEQHHKMKTGGELKGGMSAEEGVNALEIIINKVTFPQVVVSVYNLVELIRNSYRNLFIHEDKIPNLEVNEKSFICHGTETEQKIIEVWREVLGHQDIDINENFFELGGDSLSAIQISARLRQLFRINVTVRSILESPTVSELASLIESLEEKSAEDDGLILDEIEKLSEEDIKKRLNEEEYINE